MVNPIIHVVSSREDDFLYYDNLAYLRNRLTAEEIIFEGQADVYLPTQFTFNAGRVYDFTRTAKAAVRQDMTDHLINVLNPAPEVKQEIRSKLHRAFDYLYGYYNFKGYLDLVGQQRHESVNMLIFFKHGGVQFVAHVTLNSTTVRSAPNQFTSDVALVCQRFTYFPLQDTDFEIVLRALQNLHHEEPAPADDEEEE